MHRATRKRPTACAQDSQPRPGRILPVVIARACLLAAWAGVGFVGTYAALYAFTPYGLVMFLLLALIADVLPAADGRRLPEAVGLLAGPGFFCMLVASQSDEPAGWWLAGPVIVAAALATYVGVGRARCARRV